MDPPWTSRFRLITLYPLLVNCLGLLHIVFNDLPGNDRIVYPRFDDL